MSNRREGGVYVSGFGSATVYRSARAFPIPDAALEANAAVNTKLAERRYDRRVERAKRRPVLDAAHCARIAAMTVETLPATFAAMRQHPRTALPGETDAEGKPTQRWRERMNANKRTRRARR